MIAGRKIDVIKYFNIRLMQHEDFIAWRLALGIVIILEANGSTFVNSPRVSVLRLL